ncbi:polysaccharide biosynthesis protein [Pseudoxanthomonas wuyuanensis]
MTNAIAPRKDEHGDDARASGRSIAHRLPVTALSPVQLEDRATIYRSETARREVDAFRELRTQLLSLADGNFVTLVAPVSRGSGGSFVARNLAVAVAFDESKSALLVDCDLRHPSQAATMKVSHGNGGLIDYLEDPEGNADDVLYDTGVPRLRLLPAGKSRETGSEYFSSFRMRLLLDSLRSRYPNCHLFLDAPPVRGAPDARILADLADVVVLVAGYGRDTPAAIAQAAAGFDPKKFAGVVFNEGV